MKASHIVYCTSRLNNVLYMSFSYKYTVHVYTQFDVGVKQGKRYPYVVDVCFLGVGCHLLCVVAVLLISRKSTGNQGTGCIYMCTHNWVLSNIFQTVKINSHHPVLCTCTMYIHVCIYMYMYTVWKLHVCEHILAHVVVFWMWGSTCVYVLHPSST